jgi:hypothetical protein
MLDIFDDLHHYYPFNLERHGRLLLSDVQNALGREVYSNLAIRVRTSLGFDVDDYIVGNRVFNARKEVDLASMYSSSSIFVRLKHTNSVPTGVHYGYIQSATLYDEIDHLDILYTHTYTHSLV